MHRVLSIKILILCVLVVGFLAVGSSLGLRRYLNLDNFTNVHTPPNPLLKIKPVTQERPNVSLNLSSPDDNKLVFDSDLLVEGQTTPKAVVLISSDDNDQIASVSDKGDFSMTFKLKNGLNQLTISAFDKMGNIKTENRTVYYSSEKLQ